MRPTHKYESTDAGEWGGTVSSSAETFVMKVERRGRIFQQPEQENFRTREILKKKDVPMKVAQPKPFVEITKGMVWNAYLVVKANKGAGGVDGIELEEFEKDLKKNLYKIWNRMCSGSYFPPAVKTVTIPKKNGGVRTLGIPTIGDRVAQQVVKQHIEPRLEKIFHKDSYGYRPHRSALDAVGVVKERCWKYLWVLEFDIKGLFDNIDHTLLMKAVRHHVKEKWVLLYIERWLRAPRENAKGEQEERTKGTPQGGVVSPLLANLFLHYAFDNWMSKNPQTPFARYADDAVISCRNRKEAETMKEKLQERLEKLSLEIHPDKTHIVFCGNRRKGRKIKAEPTGFDFLGYTFKRRKAKSRKGEIFTGFLPGVSNKAKKSMREKLKNLGVKRRSDLSIAKIAEFLNPIIRGWITYYGKYYRTALFDVFRKINRILAGWARKTLKTLKLSYRKANKWLRRFAKENPKLFVHWQFVIP